MSLEEEAQRYANTCPRSRSAIFTRPNSGENFAMITSSTSALDAAVRVYSKEKNYPLNIAKDGFQAVRSWWSIIFRNGMNRRVVYTEFLERKPMSPSNMTQVCG
ncbi:unnamed protein product [Strongylus vulgaris]|uniref:SCP domain-containing protein n=1 Tax=Strongylus vulgaris TaxID=40348 RepID=A0A3P7JIP7_STRVU|nr:unnamed protein product [Strongylus vulgaris]